MTFTREIFNLDLRYYDTNLSKEGLLRFHRRSQCRARRKHRPREKPPRSRFTLVQRYLRREILVRMVVVGSVKPPAAQFTAGQGHGRAMPPVAGDVIVLGSPNGVGRAGKLYGKLSVRWTDSGRGGST